jgi:glycosyltransferase involved in cell wall biosynthesis
VHSTEFDREPDRPDPRICRFESEGLRRAHRIIAVSGYTRDTLVRQYGIDATAVDVVHNAVDCSTVTAGPAPSDASMGGPVSPPSAGDGVVLFLGRITAQKGPQHFLAAARRVLDVRPQTRFVMAGDGDLASFARREARRLGIAERVGFPGFLDRHEVERAFAGADVFVMPSVSEPFGIVALEAMSAGVPTIVSRQSGVAQVMRQAISFDYWDTDAQARAVVELLDDTLRRAMVGALGREEVGRLTWRESARRCVDAYQAAVAGGRFRIVSSE